MKEKDKQILKDTADVIVSNIVGLNIAWGLSKALYSAAIKLRQQRALEWVEMIKDNPSVFIKEILEDESFQDGFVFALEKYLIERNEEKRKYFRNIFLGYSKNNKKLEFELEKFIHILSQLNIADIHILGYVDTRTTSSYQLFDDAKYLENISNLISLGILNNDPSSRLGPIHSPYVFTSNTGRIFIKYLTKN